MRDSDWSRENLLRSDWLVPKGASITTLVDAVLQTVTLFTTPKKCRLTTRFKTWPLKSIHFLRTKVNITSCSKVNGSEHQLT